MAKILIVEQSTRVRQALESVLRPVADLVWVERVDEAHQVLEHQTVDIVIGSEELPDGDAFLLYEYMYRAGLDIPFIYTMGGVRRPIPRTTSGIFTPVHNENYKTISDLVQLYLVEHRPIHGH